MGGDDRLHSQHFSFSGATGTPRPRPWLPCSAAGWLWARSGDALAAAVLLVALGPFGSEGPLDQALCLVGLPLLTAAFLVATALQAPPHASWAKRLVLGSQWAAVLGPLSYPIYLFHEAIGDVYMQMAVKGYWGQWRSLLPPPGTPWWPTKYELYVSPWMSTQPAVLKLAALALSVAFGWLVQTYLMDVGVLALLGAGAQAWRWASRAVTKAPRHRHRRHRSGAGADGGPVAVVEGPVDAGAAARGGWARLRLLRGRGGAGGGGSQLGVEGRQGGATAEATVLAV